jgi:hypothetical protein
MGIDDIKREEITRLVPPSCLGIKCVYKTRVVSSVALALSLLISEEMSVSKLRRIENIDSSKARKLPPLLRRAVRVAIEHISAGDIYTAVMSVLGPAVPKKIRAHIASRFTDVSADPLSYISRVSRRRKIPAGWKIITNYLETADSFLIPKKFLWYTLEYLTSVGVSFKAEIVLCNDHECYPLPLGLYPSTMLTGLAYETGNINPILELERKYGGANLTIILRNMEDEIEETAVSIQPKKIRSKAVFFLKVGNPREKAIQLANMQMDALEAEDALLRNVMGGGYDELLLDTHKIEKIIDEVLEEETEIE